MSSLKNKVIIITGGTKGIGLATVNKALMMGATVYACSRNEVQLPENANFMKLDVTNSVNCETVASSIFEKYGHIDGLVCDAGVTKDSLIENMSDDMFDEVIRTNTLGTFNTIKAVYPYMNKKQEGSIVAISSIVGEYGNVGQINYAASKSAIIGLCKSCAKEFSRKGQNIRVNTVCPGYIMTDMLKTVPEDLLYKFSQKTMLKRLGEPLEVANVISFLLSDDSSYITGSVIDVNGGMRL